MELDSYTFVLLRRGPRADEYNEAELEEIQAGHLSFLGRMRDESHMILSGPFTDQEDETKRGFSVYRTGLEETKRLLEDDPALLAGRMSAEVMTWWTPKGTLG